MHKSMEPSMTPITVRLANVFVETWRRCRGLQMPIYLKQEDDTFEMGTGNVQSGNFNQQT